MLTFKSIWVSFLFIIIISLVYFYRYPFWIPIGYRSDNTVYSPAFWTIIDVRQMQEGHYFIAIFLSPFDIHYQFSPIEGKLIDIKYDETGQFNLAYDLNKSVQNEKAIYTIQHKRWGIFTIYQIAGKIVRRISIFRKKDDYVKSGELLGLIHFGSRVDIIIPNYYNNFYLDIRKGQKVNMNTILGKYLD